MGRDLMNPYDELGILLALRHGDRVRHICLHIPLPSLWNIVAAIDTGISPYRTYASTIRT